MGTRFWTSTATTWRLARFAVLALVGFVALEWVVGVWVATALGVVVATLLLIDDVRSRRTGATDRGSGASA